MSSAPDAAEITRDASWLVQALDPASGMVRVVRMDPEAYRDASFLDDRMLHKEHFAGIVPWSSIADALLADARTDARWIFHIGHAGSTLVARLLGDLDNVLAVREPRILRDVALLPSERRGAFVPALQKLLSRTFGDEEAALVKATSFVSEIAPELVPPGERALFLYTTARNYIGSILAGENSVKELASLAPSRAKRLEARVDLPTSRNLAEAAAAAWACEMTALEAAADAMPDRRVAWADFDAMLNAMPAELARLADFFGFSTDAVPAVAAGPLMSRYSKAAEFEYSPSLRRDLIAEADEAHRADIDSALAMLQSAAENSPLLERALRRAEWTESFRS
jgi:hypothetical protein